MACLSFSTLFAHVLTEPPVDEVRGHFSVTDPRFGFSTSVGPMPKQTL
jgi:hypothetical protein